MLAVRSGQLLTGVENIVEAVVDLACVGLTRLFQLRKLLVFNELMEI